MLVHRTQVENSNQDSSKDSDMNGKSSNRLSRETLPAYGEFGEEAAQSPGALPPEYEKVQVAQPERTSLGQR